MRRLDLSGQVFGMLTVVKVVDGAYKGNTKWECQCYCGQTTVTTVDKLKRGHTKSCGCFRRKFRRTHGEAQHRSSEYSIWAAMIRRCNSPDAKRFKRYGGRGIAVCGRWANSYENFLLDMGRRPSINHSIDRINNDGNYEPPNCRWATDHEQSRNMSRNKYIEFDGRRMILKDWCTELNISHHVIPGWIKKGKSIEWVFEHIRTSKKLKRNR